ncbi:hypothetical protein B1757_12995 [Acidithiobacillus marinus]|uniref:Uncharacterized protein n=1 Tax=Acidithiobacillus marinus TaxID=187490 RepID=A0A2I1DIV0_9PROT|nr:hypothetical protein [Acidithiobacillus marinus]PKY09798.1 hypothetical protein B1757_12995 [Acidithiobacillus marinus]
MVSIPIKSHPEADAALTELAELVSWMLNEGIRRFRVGDAGCCYWWFMDGHCPDWAASWPLERECDAFFCVLQQAPLIVMGIWRKLDYLLDTASRRMLSQEYPQYDDSQWIHGVFLEAFDIIVRPDGWDLCADVWLSACRECTGYMGTKDLEETEGYVHWRTSGETWRREIKATTKAYRNANEF